MANIEKRGKNRFRLSVVIGYDSNGNAIRERKTVQAKTLKEARVKLAEFELEVLGGNYIRPDTTTLNQFYLDWLEKYAEGSLSPDTLRDYVLIFETRILPKYGHMKLSDIKTMHIVNFINDLNKPGARLDGKPGPLSSSRINNCYKAFNNLLARATEWKLIKENPADPVNTPKVRNKKSEVYTKEEIQTIFEKLEKVDFRWQVLVSLAFVTGAREGELAALEDIHMNFEKGSIYIEQAITEVKGKGVVVKSTKNERQRHISVPEQIMNMIKKLIHIRKQEKFKVGSQWQWEDHLFLFGNEFGKPLRPDSISQWWKRFTTRHKIKHIRFHSLRHTSATHLINEGVHAKIIQERLGHTKLDTTMSIYGHVMEEADQKSATHFDTFFDKKINSQK
ncbi:tyrosine-type recombinase/integrase [Bacillus gobiensis]|uniref:tyrosine-type recombinase/integrase n=1 Tax=Bacillus gobiensis TaxID=1441095 RepID=UPI003D1F4C18